MNGSWETSAINQSFIIYFILFMYLFIRLIYNLYTKQWSHLMFRSAHKLHLFWSFHLRAFLSKTCTGWNPVVSISFGRHDKKQPFLAFFFFFLLLCSFLYRTHCPQCFCADFTKFSSPTGIRTKVVDVTKKDQVEALAMEHDHVDVVFNVAG